MRLSERKFVELLRRKAGRQAVPNRNGWTLRQGIGDDCAVLSGTGQTDLLVTTDLLLEDIHFRRNWQAPDSLGHRTLARGLSDIAAMGGTPRYAFLSLGLPPGTATRWIDQFFVGLLRLAASSKVLLAGGDTATSRSGIVADIMVLGEAQRGKALRRSNARPGDEIWVSGSLGGAAAALELLRRGKKVGRRSTRLQPLLYPQPRLALGRLLSRRGLATAMMDLSDGLSLDLSRLCEASGVGARIEAEAVPRLRQTSLERALHGGEDYELLFTVSPDRAAKVPRRVQGLKLTRIGKIIGGHRLRLLRAGREEQLPVLGFQHF